MLSEQQIERYSRQIIVPHIGGHGQQTLLSAAVAVVGAGEVGATAALYLCAAGVGRLGIVDTRPFDCGDLHALNADCEVAQHAVPLTAATAADVARDHALLIDATCRAESTVLLNGASVAQRTPIVWGTAAGASGHAAVWAGARVDAPCFQCRAWPVAAAQPDERAPMSGVTAAFIGTLLATEAIKLLLGLDAVLIGRMVLYDALTAVVDEVPVVKNPSCQACTAVGA